MTVPVMVMILPSDHDSASDGDDVATLTAVAVHTDMLIQARARDFVSTCFPGQQLCVRTDKRSDRQTDFQTDRQTVRQTDSQTDRQTVRQVDKQERERERERDRDRDRETERERQRETERHRETKTETDRDTYRDIIRKFNCLGHRSITIWGTGEVGRGGGGLHKIIMQQ